MKELLILEANPLLPVQRVHIFIRTGTVWLNGRYVDGTGRIEYDDGTVDGDITMKDADEIATVLAQSSGQEVYLYLFASKSSRFKKWHYVPGFPRRIIMARREKRTA